jgi:DNA invertase Pin-like site-specific DNA recombinase
MGRRTSANRTRPQNAVVAYVRVSTEEQAQEGVSLDAQEARIRGYCQMRGLDLIEVVIDAGVSAGKPLATREGGQRLLELVRSKKVSSVVALKLDRLFRNAADCLSTVEAWDKAGIAMHLVDIGGASVDTSSAMGRFFLTVMAGAAEMERNQIRERTSFAMQHMKQRGEYTGGRPPLGFEVTEEGQLVRVDAEHEALAMARHLRQQGLTLRAVAAELAAHGFVNRRGHVYDSKQVGRMVVLGAGAQY